MSDAATPISEPGLKGDVTTIELDRLERTVARRSAESRATIPTMEFSSVVDVGALLEREAELGCGIAALVIARRRAGAARRATRQRLLPGRPLRALLTDQCRRDDRRRRAST